MSVATVGNTKLPDGYVYAAGRKLNFFRAPKLEGLILPLPPPNSKRKSVAYKGSTLIYLLNGSLRYLLMYVRFEGSQIAIGSTGKTKILVNGKEVQDCNFFTVPTSAKIVIWEDFGVPFIEITFSL